jgi:hypothetical protein
VTSLQLERVSIGNTVVKGPENLTPLNASFLVPDAAAAGGLRKVTTAREGIDKWTADTGGVAVPVMYESPNLPQLNLRIIDLPSTTLKTAITILERQVFEPAPPGATINVSLSLPTAQAGQSYQLFTIGAWSALGLTAPAAAGTQLAPGPVVLTAGNSPIGRLDKITTDDVVTVLRFAGNQLVAHYITSFDQVAANTITGAMIATPLNQTLDLRVNQNATVARLSTVRPAVGAATFVWRVHAAPGLDYSVINGPQLHAAGVVAPTTPDPQTLTAAYGNPFPFKAIVQWDVRANRTYTGPTALTATLSAGTTERAEPSAASRCGPGGPARSHHRERDPAHRRQRDGPGARRQACRGLVHHRRGNEHGIPPRAVRARADDGCDDVHADPGRAHHDADPEHEDPARAAQDGLALHAARVLVLGLLPGDRER